MVAGPQMQCERSVSQEVYQLWLPLMNKEKQMSDLWKYKNLVLAGLLFLRSNYLSQLLDMF